LSREDEIPELVAAVLNDSKNLLLVSAHPQGGNRMGNDPDGCVVDSNCRVYGFKNLFVCDASVFPTAVGVNPQLTVMSLATIMAERIDRLLEGR
jgi:choline dehydrogenase-like flavoprotein